MAKNRKNFRKTNRGNYQKSFTPYPFKKHETIELTIDVERRTLEAPALDLEVSFELSDAVQHRFLNGLDDIGLTLQNAVSIDNFESTRPAFKPSTTA